ncbi:hypothetical protein WN944_012953 [Citrus x changshan-huyou]|uniref:2-C-methyl-D-erythritol 2,4-cyclodiphosphate synthase n=1 Tax=Citrus x changshan-huyou TaxID=2935761 RepID=A0AAP0M7Q7_9ROSI|nr:hypothetical protein CUMW_042410 [Citrus unshiu]
MVLTMAAQSYTTTPLHSKITNKPLCPPPLSLKPRSLTAKHLRTTQSTSLPRISVSAAATSSIEVKESSASIQPSKSKSLPFRVGHGFDLHRLEPGYPLIIGGINVPHERGCEAHSDGDVLLHCVVDAILGALGLPDIGQIFPDSDPKWKGAPSSVFIKEASKQLVDSLNEAHKVLYDPFQVRLMDEAGYEIGNLDATLILQRPKLSPYKETIRTNLSELLGADPTVVNLKAKTHEKVDSLGENRSIAAHTVILLMKK